MNAPAIVVLVLAVLPELCLAEDALYGPVTKFASSSSAHPVDIYVDFEGGTSGNTVTTTYLSNCTHAAAAYGGWSLTTVDSHTIVSNFNYNLLDPVSVGGTTYNDASGVHGIDYDHAGGAQEETLTLPSGVTNISIAYYISVGVPTNTFATFDFLEIVQNGGATWANYLGAAGGGGNQAWRIETTGGATGPVCPTVAVGHRCLVVVNYVTGVGDTLTLYDGFTKALIGSSFHADTGTTASTAVVLGQQHAASTGHTQWDNFMADWTHGYGPNLGAW